MSATHAGVAAALSATDTRAGDHRRRWAGIGVAVAAAALTLSVMAHQAPHLPGDVSITRLVQAADFGPLARLLDALNRLGFPPLVDFIYGGILLTLFAFGRRWEAVAGTFGVLGSAGLNDVVKFLVNRPRPGADLVHVEHPVASASFPAGHVLNFTVFAGFLCCLAFLRMPASWPRNVVIALLMGLIVLMGVARVDSGEHWASDVIGGYLLGALWLAVTVRLYRWGHFRWMRLRLLPRANPLHAVIVIAMAVAALLGFCASAQADPVAADSLGASAPSDSMVADSLGASSEAPWNPPQPMARRQGWEQAMLLPGRILSLPLVVLGDVTERLSMFAEHSPRLAHGMSSAQGLADQPVQFKAILMGDRVGLGGAVEVHQNLLHGARTSRLSAQYAATIYQYNRTTFAWLGHPLSLQYAYEWRPQELFYGVGNQTSADSISDYASQGESVRGALNWMSHHTRAYSEPRSALAVWGGPRSQVTSNGRENGEVSYDTRFPAVAAGSLDQRVEHLNYGASYLHDHRTGAPHWSRGWRTLFSAERFDAPLPALALHSGDDRGAQFTRYQAEAEAGRSFMRDPRTLRIRVQATDQQVSSHYERFLPSDLSTLGGQMGLGGYSPGRFHDLDCLLTQLEYVFPLERRLEVNLHTEWGAVYPDLWNDAKFNTLHNSFGFSLRMRDDHAPRGSIGFDFSREAVRFRFAFGGVE